MSITTDTNSSVLNASDMNSAVFIFYPSTPAIIAAAASAAKNTVQIAMRFLEILIFLIFYKCEKYEIHLQIMRMQVLLKVVTMDYIKQENQ